MASLLQLAKRVLPSPVLLDSVSLGQGQGERAKELTMAAAHKGRWVFLQNCHLSSSWMPELEAVYKRSVLVHTVSCFVFAAEHLLIN